MKALVYRDTEGRVINIGEWDLQVEEITEPVFEERPPLPNGERYQTPPTVIGRRKVGERITNPIPDGVTCQEEEVTFRDDGGTHEDGTHHGLAAVNDHVSLRRGAYPSIADQLDALWKGGDQLEAMRERVLAVKARFPKAAK